MDIIRLGIVRKKAPSTMLCVLSPQWLPTLSTGIAIDPQHWHIKFLLI